MTVTTISSREFNQHISEAKKAANKGPVFITDRGRPAHVLLSMKDYQHLSGSTRKISDLLALPGIENLELEIPQLRDFPRPAELS